MEKIFHLKGYIQNYAWGGQNFIPSLLGFSPSNDTYAEYWLGAHVNAPSKVQTEAGSVALDEFLNKDPKGFLGEELYNQFGRLPFLFKVLDVHEMLSIQVHPSKKEAEKGFLRENKLGIPLTAAHRNYKDDNHKPEIMVALSDFWLLHGFLPKNKLLEVLQQYPDFADLIPIFKDHGLKGLYQYIMQLSIEDSDKILRPLVQKTLPLFEQNSLSKSSPDYWAAKSVLSGDKDIALDKGIFSIYFFNIVKLSEGEAIFQDAGVPHAYLEGQNMELMANSDNVLRAGLTPKHIDIEELLKHVVFKETEPCILKGELQSDKKERIFKTSAPDFQLSKISLKKGEVYRMTSKSAEICILMEGNVQVTENDTILQIKKGDAFLVIAQSNYKISATSQAVLFKAGTP